MGEHEKLYWMGETIDDLPREKLVEIINYLARDLDRTRETMRSIIDLNRMALERKMTA